MSALQSGQTYQNWRGDFRGPMEERAPGVWLDQYGMVYRPDGTQWDHVPSSTANLDLATAGTTEGWREEPVP